jgi:hypothetical protein
MGTALKGISEARVSCAESIKIIDRKPKIPLNVGQKLKFLNGDI